MSLPLDDCGCAERREKIKAAARFALAAVKALLNKMEQQNARNQSDRRDSKDTGAGERV